MLSQIIPSLPQELSAFMAARRFKPYSAVFGGDQKRATQLYLLNVELSGALLELLHFAEIGLRERMHQSLSSVYGDRWYNDGHGILDARTKKKIEIAKRHYSPRIDAGKIVAELNFGAWTDLLSVGGQIRDEDDNFVKHANYERDLWVPALSQVFNVRAHIFDRAGAESLTRKVRRARNRISHHEAIVFGVPQPRERTSGGKLLRQTPQAVLSDLKVLLSVVCPPGMVEWLDSCGHAQELIDDELAHDAFDYALRVNRKVEWI